MEGSEEGGVDGLRMGRKRGVEKARDRKGVRRGGEGG